MSTLKFWNKNNDSNEAKTEAKNAKNGRNWLHAPDALVNGHVAYLVKFLGTTPVDQPKGIEVVKEAIRRLQFTQQIKKAEGGNNIKMKKVEITISVDGVAVQVSFVSRKPLRNLSITHFRFRSREQTTFCTSFRSIKSVTAPTKKAWKSSSASSRRRARQCKRSRTATRPALTHRHHHRSAAWPELRKNLTNVTSSSRTNSLPTSHWRSVRRSTWLIVVTWRTRESNLKSQSCSRTTRSWREPCRRIAIACGKSPRFSRSRTWTSYCCAYVFAIFARFKSLRSARSMETRRQI